jgi:TetR/AcrR family transcriptional regulator, regulator of autoinduction and epiphytic fitness
MTVEEFRVDPRITRTRRAVLDAALAELADRGYGAFTIDGVASRAGVARSTIYRQWGDRTTLIGEAIDVLNRQPPAGPTTDESPRDRVITLLRHLSDAMRHSPVAACLPALIDGAERDAAVRRLHHRYNDRRRAVLVAAVGDAVEAGDAHDSVNPDLAATALAGAVIYRRLMTARTLRSEEVEALVDTVLGARGPSEEHHGSRPA